MIYAVYTTVLIILFIVPDVLSQCSQVQVNGCMIAQACGVYYIWPDGDPCSGVVVYKHLESTRLLYEVDGFWIIHDETCSSLGVDASDLRVEDRATHAEDISNVWQESNNGFWVNNESVAVECVSGKVPDEGGATVDPNPDDSSSSTIIYIVIICVGATVVIIVIVITSILCCKKKEQGHQQTPKSTKRENILSPYMTNQRSDGTDIETIEHLYHMTSSQREGSVQSYEYDSPTYYYPISAI